MMTFRCQQQQQQFLVPAKHQRRQARDSKRRGRRKAKARAKLRKRLPKQLRPASQQSRRATQSHRGICSVSWPTAQSQQLPRTHLNVDKRGKAQTSHVMHICCLRLGSRTWQRSGCGSIQQSRLAPREKRRTTESFGHVFSAPLKVALGPRSLEQRMIFTATWQRPIYLTCSQQLRTCSAAAQMMPCPACTTLR